MVAVHHYQAQLLVPRGNVCVCVGGRSMDACNGSPPPIPCPIPHIRFIAIDCVPSSVRIKPLLGGQNPAVHLRCSRHVTRLRDVDK